MDNKHMKRCSIPLVIMEMKIKTTMRFHFTCTWMTTIKKKQKMTSVDEDAEKSDPSYIAGGNVKWCCHYQKQLVVPQKAKHRISI